MSKSTHLSRRVKKMNKEQFIAYMNQHLAVIKEDE